MIDAIKSLQIIEDDSFHHLDIYSSGTQGTEDMLEGFLIPYGYLSNFIEKCTVHNLNKSNAHITRLNDEILAAERNRILDESKFF